MLPLILSATLLMTISNHEVRGIINGIPARQEDFKYMVALRYMNEQGCGGAILDETHILTAAHCFSEDSRSHYYSIYAGVKTQRAWFPTKRKIINIQIPHDYEGPGCVPKEDHCSIGHPKSDIAVLTLDKPLELKDKIAKIQLPKRSDQLPLCDLCYLAGWGRTTEGTTKSSNKLLYMEIITFDVEQCRSVNWPTRDDEFCAMDGNMKATAALGDSGGPVVCNGVVYGVLSIGCFDPNLPIGFINVMKYLDFIEAAMTR